MPADEVQTWEDELGAPLPDDPAEVADAVFDDSYNQIKQ